MRQNIRNRRCGDGMKNLTRILIVGGYGIFGGRLVELLEDGPDLTLIVTGRSVKKAHDYCKSRAESKATLIPASFDRNAPTEQIKTLKPDIIIDASGPFQDYGAAQYRLVEACIAHQVHYLDLADGSEFVKGIYQFDSAAKAAGVFILSGVSSFPVLTALVVRELLKDMDSVESIHGGIAPSPFAGVGENVIRAIAGYAGQPVPVKKDGTIIVGYPFTESIRYTISPPGYVPLKNILFSLVDVPDLRVLPELWPDARTVWMGAGPVPEILHRVLIGFSWMVRWKILPSLTPIVKLIQFVMNTVRWGEHRGGMFVEVNGLREDKQPVRKSWHLLAEGRDGPLIPCMAVEAIMRKLFRGEAIEPGARTAIDDLALSDYERLFSRRTIYTGFRLDEPPIPMPLYQSVLGATWNQLPVPIRNMHDVAISRRAEGLAIIERGTNPFARMIADMIGFPQAGTDVPVSVDFNVFAGTEQWMRTFNGRSFKSWQSRGYGRTERLLIERFGPMRFAMALVTEESEQKLRLVLRSWSFLGISMPMALCPASDSYEIVEDGKFHFHVKISHPLVGLIIHYRGWLNIIDQQAD